MHFEGSITLLVDVITLEILSVDNHRALFHDGSHQTYFITLGSFSSDSEPSVFVKSNLDQLRNFSNLHCEAYWGSKKVVRV